jgi:histidine triad (HIT) family protein
MNIFKKIIDKEIPAKILFEDQFCIAIQDVAPQAPVHVLIIPKKEIRSMNEALDSDQNLLGHLLLVAKNLARQLNLSESGYRLIFNTNRDAGQTVFHLHLHLMGGETLAALGTPRKS